jgi:ATP-dependent helicase HrpB
VADVEIVEWDDAAGLQARTERRLGAIVLSARRVMAPHPHAVAEALAEAVRRRGLALLPWTEAAVRLRERLAFLHHVDPSWPDVSDDALPDALFEHLAPQLAVARGSVAVSTIDVHAALLQLLTWTQRTSADQLAPSHFTAPSGSRVPIDYSDPSAPAIGVRLQEMFGCAETPTVFGGRVRLTVRLLSPAHRPVQVTQDLASFWRTSYFDVRKDLRARYPKHPWPQDPLAAPPTSRAGRPGPRRGPR